MCLYAQWASVHHADHLSIALSSSCIVVNVIVCHQHPVTLTLQSCMAMNNRFRAAFCHQLLVSVADLTHKIVVLCISQLSTDKHGRQNRRISKFNPSQIILIVTEIKRTPCRPYTLVIMHEIRGNWQNGCDAGSEFMMYKRESIPTDLLQTRYPTPASPVPSPRIGCL